MVVSRLSPLSCLLVLAGTVIARDLFRPADVFIKVSTAKNYLIFTTGGTTGTAACANAACDIVLTNYHVAQALGSSPRIQGEKVSETFLATGPEDDGAVWVQTHFGPPMKYNPARDIALLRLEKPLARKGMRGLPFYPFRLQEGESVTVYGYPGGGKLSAFPARFLREGFTRPAAADSLLEFEVAGKSDTGATLRGGISGGLVLNSRSQVVGLVWALGGNNIVQAVPIWAVADFMAQVEPRLFAELFPESATIYRPSLEDLSESVEPAAIGTLPDLTRNPETSLDGITPEPALPASYLRTELRSPAMPSTAAQRPALRRRQPEPPAIQALRRNAQAMVEEMKNFIAIQTLHFGGTNAPLLSSQYEVRVLDGAQAFRKWPDGDRERVRPDMPFANGVIIGAEWSTLPWMVGSTLKLSIRQMDDIFVDGQKLHVFRYQAGVEDEVCAFLSVKDYLLWQRTWDGPVACSGEVWTDQEFRILRITKELYPPPNVPWRKITITVLYGWLDIPYKAPRLLPSLVLMQGDYEDGHSYWCQGWFTNYRVFVTSIRIAGGAATETDR